MFDRFVDLRPLAPAELVPDVDVHIRLYAAVADDANVAVLGGLAEPLPAAAARLAAHCGIDGSRYRMGG